MAQILTIASTHQAIHTKIVKDVQILIEMATVTQVKEKYLALRQIQMAQTPILKMQHNGVIQTKITTGIT
jgi:hypothetical protein